jgi:hypothetical protein
MKLTIAQVFYGDRRYDLHLSRKWNELPDGEVDLESLTRDVMRAIGGHPVTLTVRDVPPMVFTPEQLALCPPDFEAQLHELNVHRTVVLGNGINVTWRHCPQPPAELGRMDRGID